MIEKEIIETSLVSLNKEIPVIWNWNNKDIKSHKAIDGILNLTLKNRKISFNVEIKKNLKSHQLLTVIQNKQNMNDFLLIVEKIDPKIKKELRENHINYLESNGNIYIENEDIYLLLDNNKTIKQKREPNNRAFTKTGLKVVFHFLLNPEIINLPQREIAEITNVALGNIPQVISGLLDNNYLLKENKNTYSIVDYQQLLNKWISEYEQTLRPTLFKQRFKQADQNQKWNEISLYKDQTVWGGEPAGDILTHHLRPEKLTLYTKETTNELIRNYKIFPHTEGEIWVYSIFWNIRYNYDITAPVILVYSDLMLTNDKRCIEIANIIFNEHIQPNL
ncbi:type IV toxin-antitoxin system AbiEi family antitoxin [Chryseobacterium sp. NRRL B-14859]|uniref:type IV toxin-antitoxin system AbiEi family antitoxin n=1 Tax=unclassified Chryseobacterium TaxID=2593645 RepID=UPI00333E47DF